MTNSFLPYDKAQLADDLATLIDVPLTCKADLGSWNRLAHAVREKLMTGDAAVLGPIPQSLHDYLSDAEIRLYDPDYGAAQQRIIGRLIDRLRQESEPARAAFG